MIQICTRRFGTGRERFTSKRDDRYSTTQSGRHLIAVELRNQIENVRGVNISERADRRLGESG